MMKKILQYIFLISCIVLLNCGKTERVDTEQVKEALKQREIKKISEVEISEAGLREGKKISTALIECFNKKGSFLSYRQCLDSTNLPMLDTLKVISYEHSESLKGVEKELFEAYIYNFKNNLELLPNLQDLKNQQLLYTHPAFHYRDDSRLHGQNVDDQKPDSFGILFLYLNKKELILNI